MVVPALAALLPDATFEVVRDLGPILGPVSMNLLNQQSVFLLGPRALHHLGVQHLLPPVQALDIRTELKALSNAFPVFGAHLPNELAQFFVLHRLGCVKDLILLLTSASVQ